LPIASGPSMRPIAPNACAAPRVAPCSLGSAYTETLRDGAGEAEHDEEEAEAPGAELESLRAKMRGIVREDRDDDAEPHDIDEDREKDDREARADGGHRG